MVRSPFRNDEKPSVSITVKGDGTVLIFDHGDPRCGASPEDQRNYFCAFLSHYGLEPLEMFGRGRRSSDDLGATELTCGIREPDVVEDHIVEAFTQYIADRQPQTGIALSYVDQLPSCLMSLDGRQPAEWIKDRFDSQLSYRFEISAARDLQIGFDADFHGESCGGPHWPDTWAHEGAWVYPERDGDGRIVGAGLRLVGQPVHRGGSTKRAVVLRQDRHQVRGIVNGKRGLILPQSLLFPSAEVAVTQPLFLPEGLSDVIAIASIGGCAIGRPSMQPSRNVCGWLARYILRTGWSRVIVLGERDKDSLDNHAVTKSKSAAHQLASQLAERTHRDIEVMIPALGFKDAREQYASGAVSRGFCEHVIFRHQQ
jgi:hypothetical protein